MSDNASESSKRKWVPNKERKVRSKKSFDQERVKNITSDNKRIYKDMLIYRNGYSLTSMDKHFITILTETRRHYL